MKKLVSASVVLMGVCSGTIASLPALAQAADGQAAPAQGQAASGLPASCSQVTIKDPTEYNAYANATSQSTPQAKAQAIEAFLQQYPNSVVKENMLQTLMQTYEAFDAAKALDAAKRVLQVNANNLPALAVAVYIETTQANNDQSRLDQAAADAQKGLTAPKGECMTQADYDKTKDAAAPIFYRAIGSAAMAKKDYKAEIDAFTNELKAYKDPKQTTVVPGLLDTYYLGNAYVSLDSKDPNNQKMAVWFLTRAAQFSKPPYQQQIENAAEYWYKKYHCAPNDAACNTTPPQGFQQIQQLAAVPENVFPPAEYNPTQAPPPPSPADLAHQAVASTPDLKQLALSDKEFVLANGSQDDAQKVWAVMNGVTAEVPVTVVSGTPDSLQVAVSQDAQQSNKADFTINMKTPLKEVPAAGTKMSVIATFDSYTQNPPMIIMKDGEVKPEKKAAPARRTTRRPH